MNIRGIVVTLIFIFLLAVFSYIGDIGCLIRRFIHIPCPTCGMTRAFLSLIKGDIYSYFYFNAFAVPVGIVVVIMLASKIIPKPFFYLGLTILTLNFFYYTYRLFFELIP